MLDYLMYDADNHLYEGRDAFTRHLPADRSRDVYWITDERGRQHVVVGGKVWDFIPNPTFDPWPSPGPSTAARSNLSPTTPSTKTETPASPRSTARASRRR